MALTEDQSKYTSSFGPLVHDPYMQHRIKREKIGLPNGQLNSNADQDGRKTRGKATKLDKVTNEYIKGIDLDATEGMCYISYIFNARRWQFKFHLMIDNYYHQKSFFVPLNFNIQQ